ncbi:MAG: redoxin domain-containing protein [Chitinophagaceae bacterium]|nr:redoxin domain-containing protein [Chitinophagaceae bacterium]
MKLIHILLLCPFLSVAQPNKISPSTVGDQLPDVKLTGLIHHPKETTSLSSFKGKFILLDFFGSWCGSCVTNLSKLDSLQEAHRDKLQILVIASEGKERIRKFLATNKFGKNTKLVFVTGETSLNVLFPHRMLPHVAWISDKSEILGITGGGAISPANMEIFFSRQPLEVAIKRDAMDFNKNRPLLENGNAVDSSNLYGRSIFTKHIPGVPSMRFVKSENGLRRYCYTNETILGLYWTALEYPKNRIILEVSDSSRFLNNAEDTGEWYKQNTYSYDITLPAGAPKSRMRELLHQDLDRYLQMTGKMERRTMKCWIIRKSHGFIGIRAKGGESKTIFSETYRRYNNRPFKTVINAFNDYFLPSPGEPIICDETGLDYNVDMEIPRSAFKDIELLRRTLERYHLTLEPAEREMEVFVLRSRDAEKNNAGPNQEPGNIPFIE